MPMYKVVTFAAGGKERPGIVVGGKVAAINEASKVFSGSGHWQPGPADPRLVENDLLAILNSWEEWRPSLEKLAGLVEGHEADGQFIWRESEVKLLPPLRRPGKIMMAGANYYDHIAEMGVPRPDKTKIKPFFFLKAGSSIIGPNEPILIPQEVKKLDWECEFAIVIGKRARRVKAADWLDYVVGFTILNDVSARDYIARKDNPFGMDWVSHKSQDTLAPLGPYIVPKEFVPEPLNLKIKCSVNGVLHQNSNTKELIFTPDEMIEYLSALMTLEPGDIISTGSPAGVGMGKNLFLQPGDEVVAEIEHLGRLANPVMAEVSAGTSLTTA